jgi:hypothetical protein
MMSSVGWDGPGRGSASLTYYVGKAPSYLGQDQVEAALETALQAWARVVDVTFTQTSRPNQRDSIDFQFVRLDGAGGTLAQAFFPDDVNGARIAGDVQFDSSERWEVGNSQGKSAFDLVLVAVHELGHSLGLDHSPATGAVMAPSVSPTARFTSLSANDIDAALSLYAPASPRPAPLPGPSTPVANPGTSNPQVPTNPHVPTNRGTNPGTTLPEFRPPVNPWSTWTRHFRNWTNWFLSFSTTRWGSDSLSIAFRAW